jgi:hypothetical protein
MQQQHSPAATQEIADSVQAPAQGPVLLDLSLQELVSGGAPKGGWPVASAVETDPAPKGGW